MKTALVIGANGFIGKRLCGVLWTKDWEVVGWTRQNWDLAVRPPQFPAADVVFICAAMSKFMDCEANRLAYRVNVDAPTAIGRRFRQFGRVVFLSSEAVEGALHTNYGMHKALAEMGLRAECDPVIVRLSRVTPDRLDECCDYLAGLATASPGIYWWPTGERNG